MMKYPFLFIFFTLIEISLAAPLPSVESQVVEQDNATVSNMNPAQPSMNSMNMMMSHHTKPKVYKPLKTGDFGLDNLRLSSSYSMTSFDDGVSDGGGHYDNYSLVFSADISESDTISLGLSRYRMKLGGVNDLEVNSNGLSLSWLHALDENWSVGAFGIYDFVDIEGINGNSFGYAFGSLITSYHSFEYFDLSTATSFSYADFDLGNDSVLMASVSFSRELTDSLGAFVTLGFVDSFRSDPQLDSTYGTWEVGARYDFNDNLSLTVSYEKTEFLNNYDDNTLLIDLSWLF